jgi:hypothetical protein
MKKLTYLGMAVVLLFFTATVTQADVLTFDDITPPSSTVPNGYGYGGLHWTNISYANGSQEEILSGYYVGRVSGDYVAYNGNGTQAYVFVNSNSFDFIGAYLTGAWNDGLQINVSGSSNGVLVGDTTVTASAYSPTWFQFNYYGIDELVFSSFGGTDVYPAGEGTHFVMDNFTFNVTSVPEPSTLLLLGSGLVGLLGFRRKFNK